MPERAFWRGRKGHIASTDDINHTLSTSYTNRKIRAQSRTENLFFVQPNLSELGDNSKAAWQASNTGLSSYETRAHGRYEYLLKTCHFVIQSANNRSVSDIWHAICYYDSGRLSKDNINLE